MWKMLILYYVFIALALTTISSSEDVDRTKRQVFQAAEQDLDKFIKNDFEPIAEELCKREANATWDYIVDLNNADKQAFALQESLTRALFNKQYYDMYFQHMTWRGIKDISLQRKIMALTTPGNAALNEIDLGDYLVLMNNMTITYVNSKICPFLKQNCDSENEGLPLQPDLEDIMATSTDLGELSYVWESWRDVTGKTMKPLFEMYLNLTNQAAKANKFPNQAELWKSAYEIPDLEDVLERLWLEVKPLYDELHTYVMHKLRKFYRDDTIGDDGLIPAHLLGNMWAQNWVSLTKVVRPFPDASEVDVTAALNKQGYTPLKMFQIADEFYQTLGMEPAAMTYNVSAGAMIEKPVDREVQCHPTAWDFCDGKNYRIKMCTQVNFKDFLSAHRVLGHVHYYMLYKHQPITLREAVNPGFQEAIGDTIALSAATPNHLKKIGLLQNYEDDEASNINRLMDMALEKVAFLPFSLLVDKWRWDVFSGKVIHDNWNSHWWKYRQLYQKVKPPVARSENDFDPGSKFHVIADSQFVSYFIAQVLEFQLYRSLCIDAEEYDGVNGVKFLHKCDFYKSTVVGKKLREGLSLGASRHWSVVLEKIAGEKELSGKAMMDYFKPLHDFLREENKKLV